MRNLPQGSMIAALPVMTCNNRGSRASPLTGRQMPSRATAAWRAAPSGRDCRIGAAINLPDRSHNLHRFQRAGTRHLRPASTVK